ncbi:MAG: TetR family transcriptional regulator [Ekhidna sp.]|nr:TetR family transcriptional regulator [Ekhidna sp.]
MKTKERIALNALELFNNQGVKEVTLRQIANSLKISHGNLNYHYKLKEQIISDLYYRLVEELDIEMNKLEIHQNDLSMLYESSAITMKILYRFRFLLKDLYSILSADSSLKDHYLGLQKLRKTQYLTLFTRLQSAKIIRNEDFKGEFSRLYERMNILGDNWINASIFFMGDSPQIVAYYHELLFELIYPYLTEKGKKLYLEMIDSRSC